MEDSVTAFENILSRSDGSYLIDRNGFPCHVPNDGEFAELWQEVHAYALAHPEEVTEEPPPATITGSNRDEERNP